MPQKEVPSGVPDGWFDLDAQGIIDAVTNLNRRNLRETDEHMIRSRVTSFRDSNLISEETAEELLAKLDSLARCPRRR
ncbi:MAG: hypothetical protein UX03_C0039G0002 [Candidatus Woesebacteria bacterium GW2011_GWE1_45_18]|uniref:Uncharacterized protein n=2 Tax=Candidatus Woeseibacteriota TaxID=1752722 RepID=A0A1F8D411_9BACT|nr:MAG: hypothetical protein UX03_C0039G0002 [Candidatus Woesebacteria bacterium GW2011_GWE1_45_18]OGM83330.1 MAG: hypothetical protein A2376_01040 [Candidatus Woesebacteria bacterium RIFOXYB1_FULL_47_31]